MRRNHLRSCPAARAFFIAQIPDFLAVTSHKKLIILRAAATLKLYDPLNASNYKNSFTDLELGHYSGNSNRYVFQTGGVYRNTSAVNAFRIKMNSGNFSGTVRCYGVAH